MMLHKFILLLLCTLSSLAGWAANATKIPAERAGSIDDMADFLKEKSLSKVDMLWSIQTWMSENMKYDLAKNAKIEELERQGRSNMRKGNPLSPSATPSMEEEAQAAFRAKSGVCADFTKLFVVWAGKVGVDMFYVKGTTHKGESHAWCACIMDGVPYLFDPTWGAGHWDENTSVYEKRVDASYFMVAPESFVKEHIPFDPLFQFSEYPLSYDLKPQNRYFNWRDTLSLYQQQDSLAQMQGIYRRVLQNGKRNDVIEYDLYTLKQNLQVLKYNTEVDLYNRLSSNLGKISLQIVDIHNLLVDQKYISHNLEANLRKTLDRMGKDLDDADAQIVAMGAPSKDLLPHFTKMRRMIVTEKARLDKCSALLKKKKSDESRTGR
ncbi:MAG: hypothetical protein J6Y37_18245 [Paludibacteraceae bacterium]|nr:hypothetical protein [Paludibacteraceae bacterium]